jgi:hypothetical protein
MLLGSGVARCDATDATIDTDDTPDDLVTDGLAPAAEVEPDPSAAARFGVADCQHEPRIARLMRRLQPIVGFRVGPRFAVAT